MTVVSSANIETVSELKQFGKSLMNTKMSRGPRIDPCGTPHFNGSLRETSFIKQL